MYKIKSNNNNKPKFVVIVAFAVISVIDLLNKQ